MNDLHWPPKPKVADEQYLALCPRPDVLGRIDEDAVESLGTVGEVRERLSCVLVDWEVSQRMLPDLMRALGVEEGEQ